MQKILIINGPNLNLTGKRQPGVYGNTSFDGFLRELRADYPEMEIGYYQSNIEGELIDQLQAANSKYNGILLNAGGYTHTSVSIADCLEAIDIPVVEVHISNILARESFRHVSLLAPHCAGTITGFGLNSYRLALQALVFLLVT